MCPPLQRPVETARILGNNPGGGDPGFRGRHLSDQDNAPPCCLQEHPLAGRPSAPKSLGGQTVGTAVLTSLAVGPLNLTELPVLTEDLSSLRRIDRRIEGIVGLNALSRFNYLLDYRRKALPIEDGSDILASIDGKKVPAF